MYGCVCVVNCVCAASAVACMRMCMRMCVYVSHSLMYFTFYVYMFVDSRAVVPVVLSYDKNVNSSLCELSSK